MNTPTVAPKPRTRPTPSARDQKIYLDYQVTGRRQTDLAEQYKLTQCRISQILRRVEHWLSVGCVKFAADETHQSQPETANLKPETWNLKPESSNPAALERRLERERLNFVCREAMQHFHHEQKTTTHKKGTRGDKPYEETTERIHPQSLQALKVVLQATRQLEKVGCVKRTNVGWDQSTLADAGPPSPTCNLEPETCNSAAPSSPPDSASSPYEPTYPELPNVNGWYSPEYDETGRVIAWQRTDYQTPDSMACVSGAQPAECMSEAKCTTDQPTTISSTCAFQPDSPQLQHQPNVPTQTPKPKSKYKPQQTSNVKPETWNSGPSDADDPLDRRLRHYEKLAQLRQAQRRGLPCMIHLDPNDGPIPHLEYQLDDPGYQPTIQTKDQQAQLVRDYMQKLHDQNNPQRQRGILQS